MTAAELDLALALMSQSDTELRQLLAPVTTPQWHWKPNDESWSLCQIAEHLVIVEQGILFRLRTATADGIEKTVGKERLPAMLVDRRNKFPAPARTQPSGTKFDTPEECLTQLTTARTNTMGWALDADTKLMEHVMPHPAFGDLHGGQWLQMLAGHTLRHLEQMRELMALPGYPV